MKTVLMKTPSSTRVYGRSTPFFPFNPLSVYFSQLCWYVLFRNNLLTHFATRLTVQVTVSYRFDYSISGLKRTYQIAPPGTTVKPSHVDSVGGRFPTPTFNVGMGALSVSVVVLSALATVSPFCAKFFLQTAVGAMLTIPITLAYTIFGIHRLGLFQEWYKYEEVWIPSTDDQVADRLARGVVSDTMEKSVDIWSLVSEDKTVAMGSTVTDERTAFLQV
jgi:hypothetical protein